MAFLSNTLLETRHESERSRSSSTRTDNPIECTDDYREQFGLDQETASNLSVHNNIDDGGDDNHCSSTSTLSINDSQPDRSIEYENEVVLMDWEIANTDENVKGITIVLVGNSFAGKSSFIHWLHKKKPDRDPKVTTGGEPSFIGASINGQHYVVTLMDTAGTEKFHSVPPSWYRNADGAIVMYDITEYESFKHVTTWKQRVERNCRNDNIPYILVGNKVDIEDQLHIEGEQVAKDLKMDGYLKTSAKTGEGIDIAIKTIIVLVSKSVATHQPKNQENHVTKPKNQETIVIKPETQEIIAMNPVILDRVKRKTQRSQCC
ncbi:ras-related protein Rab-14-like [Dysidea avara]|uniref:ras-related protein Rab-14-like n=1 Tax=Dysidea avara TaxID=196820 RepID=UPI00332BC8AB